jgi:hypothetical protein
VTASSYELFITISPLSFTGQVEHLLFDVLALNGLKAMPSFGESCLGATPVLETERKMPIRNCRMSIAVEELEQWGNSATEIAIAEAAHGVNYCANLPAR